MAIYMWREGWQPGANTLAYFPFESDAIDVMGNYTLTNTGTQEAIGRSFTSTSELNSIPTTCKTTVARVYINQLGTTAEQGQAMILRGITTNFTMMLSARNMTQAPTFYLYYDGSEYFAGNNILTTGQWYLLTMTMDTKLKCYINTTEYTLYNGANLGAPDMAYIAYKSYAQPLNVVLSKVIFEDKARTAQEISDYYNQTKGNYGL